MCTCGVISTISSNGEPIILLAKTLDFYQTGFWHGSISHTNGNEALGFGVTAQIGVNSGFNEKGLGVLLSYLDYRGPFQAQPKSATPRKWKEDDRALINAEILAECATIEEALAHFYETIPNYPDLPGGNHMLADAEGNLAVLEHCNGEINHKYYTKEGLMARGNNGLLTAVEEQMNIPEIVQIDRIERSIAMEKTLRRIKEKPISEQETIDHIKQTLGSHHRGGGQKPGNICIHDYTLPGARASTDQKMSTVTAIIFNLTKKEMYYTKTSPCKNEWFTKKLESTQNFV